MITDVRAGSALSILESTPVLCNPLDYRLHIASSVNSSADVPLDVIDKEFAPQLLGLVENHDTVP